ncbi:MAG: tripartite tricarboxylate transporter substrate binding protein, partial [Rhodospirillales bacterium]|nr:tripartite tricarboxylate transporter substrate binding protein [Rhodospirillales bacterium]
ITRRTTLALGAGALAAPAGWAQTAFPEKPIRLVVGFAPGGPTDVLARLLAERLTETIGQQVLVENKPGAAGNLASEQVAKARPDGHTVLFGTSIMSLVPTLYATLPYDPHKDLDPVAHISSVPLILVVPPGGARTTEELVAMLRKEPGKHSYPTPGNGSLIHLTSHLFAARAGGAAMHVPYRGSGPAMQDTLAGRHAFQFDTLGSSKGFLDAGKLRLLGVSTEARVPAMKDVPTIEERAGFPFVSRTWNVLFVPAGTPKAAIEKLNAATNAALRHPALAEKAAALAIDLIADSTPASAGKYYLDQIAYWAPIAKASGAKVE